MRRSGWVRGVMAIMVAFLFSALLAACSGSGGGDFPSVGDRAPQEDGGGEEFPSDNEAGPTDPGGDRMIIRTKVLRLEVDDTPGSIDEVRGLAPAEVEPPGMALGAQLAGGNGINM